MKCPFALLLTSFCWRCNKKIKKIRNLLKALEKDQTTLTHSFLLPAYCLPRPLISSSPNRRSVPLGGGRASRRPSRRRRVEQALAEAPLHLAQRGRAGRRRRPLRGQALALARPGPRRRRPLRGQGRPLHGQEAAAPAWPGRRGQGGPYAAAAGLCTASQRRPPVRPQRAPARLGGDGPLRGQGAGHVRRSWCSKLRREQNMEVAKYFGVLTALVW